MTPLWKRIFAERRSVLVPLAALIVIDVVLLAAVVLPLRKVVASDRTSADATKLSTAISLQRLKQMQNARTSRERAEKELTKFYGEVLPTSQPAATSVLMLEIAKIARENSLTLQGRSWDNESIKDSTLQKLTTKVELLGDYGALLHFIYDIETAEAFLAIKSVQIAQSTRTQQNAGQLQLAVEISTYYQVPAAASK